MAKTDTLDKIIFSYFKAITNEPFTYKGKTIQPTDLRVSPLLLRDFKCPEHCGACCTRFSLDYLPNEPHPYELDKRMVEFNGKKIPIYSDMQKDHDDHFCRNLNQDNGRCGIHGIHPFSCDFELIRFFNSTKEDKPDRLSQTKFGRAWAMKKIDGERGALVEMEEPTSDSTQEVRRKLARLEQWTFHFEIFNTKIPDILAWIDEVAVSVIQGRDIPNHTIPTDKSTDQPKTLL